VETRCFQVAAGTALFQVHSHLKAVLFSVWHWGILPAKHCLNLACLFVFLSAELALLDEPVLESRSAGWIVRHTAKICQPFDFMTFLPSNYTKKVPLFALPISSNPMKNRPPQYGCSTYPVRKWNGAVHRQYIASTKMAHAVQFQYIAITSPANGHTKARRGRQPEHK
jgi:hypothetical protein